MEIKKYLIFSLAYVTYAMIIMYNRKKYGIKIVEIISPFTVFRMRGVEFYVCLFLPSCVAFYIWLIFYDNFIYSLITYYKLSVFVKIALAFIGMVIFYVAPGLYLYREKEDRLARALSPSLDLRAASGKERLLVTFIFGIGFLVTAVAAWY